MTVKPSGTRRDTPNSHSKTVRLWSPRGGEEHMGFFRVPRSAVTLDKHTNKMIKYDQEVVTKVKEWIEWKLRQDLTMVSKPIVYIPVDSPTANPNAESEDGDDMRIYVRATFRQTVPKFMSLDLFLDRKDTADRHGVDFEDKVLSENTLPEPQKELVASGERDSMKLAETRRQALGLKRSLLVEDNVAVGGEVHK